MGVLDKVREQLAKKNGGVVPTVAKAVPKSAPKQKTEDYNEAWGMPKQGEPEKVVAEEPKEPNKALVKGIKDSSVAFQAMVLLLAADDELFRLSIFSNVGEAPIFEYAGLAWVWEQIRARESVSIFVAKELMEEYQKSPSIAQTQDQVGPSFFLKLAEAGLDEAAATFVKERATGWMVRQALKNSLDPFLRKLDHQPGVPVLDEFLSVIDKERENAARLEADDEQDSHKKRRAARRAEIEASAGSAIPTMIPGLDDLLNGGIRSKQFGIYMAKTGGGKSAFLQWCAVKAAEQGKYALFITLELDRTTIESRIDSQLTKIDYGTIEGRQAEVDNRLKNINTGDRILVKEFPAGTAANKIESYIKRLENKPDIILLDYIDEMGAADVKLQGNDRAIKVAEEVRDLAKRLNSPIWTASQVNREGIMEKKPDIAHMAGSMQKVFKCDILIQQWREENAELDEIVLYLAKSRGSKPEEELQVVTHFNTMTFCDIPATIHMHKLTAKLNREDKVV